MQQEKSLHLWRWTEGHELEVETGDGSGQFAIAVLHIAPSPGRQISKVEKHDTCTGLPSRTHNPGQTGIASLGVMKPGR